MSLRTGFLGFALGALGGAIVSLMYAPRSGQETRQLLMENSEEMKANALDSIQAAQETALSKLAEVQTRVEAMSNEAKERLAELQAIGKETTVKQKEALEEGYEKAKEVIAGDTPSGEGSSGAPA